MLRPVTKINVQQDFNKILLYIYILIIGDVATEFKWYGLIRNPRVSFKGHVDSEAIQVDETFVEIHAEDNDKPATSFTRPGMDPTTNMDLLLDMDDTDRDNNWTSQSFEFLNRRPPRSQMPRFTNRDQLNRGSCFF